MVKAAGSKKKLRELFTSVSLNIYFNYYYINQHIYFNCYYINQHIIIIIGIIITITVSFRRQLLAFVMRSCINAAFL